MSSTNAQFSISKVIGSTSHWALGLTMSSTSFQFSISKVIHIYIHSTSHWALGLTKGSTSAQFSIGTVMDSTSHWALGLTRAQCNSLEKLHQYSLKACQQFGLMCMRSDNVVNIFNL